MWHFFFFRSKIREQSFSTSSSCCGVLFFSRFQDWFIQIFWNVDLMVSFLTGYYDEGALIFSLPKIALHYAKTWLLFDLSLLSMDWTFRIMVPWMIFNSQPEKEQNPLQLVTNPYKS